MTITAPEINDALIRSGYLLEARVEKYLSDKWGAFVEANASYQDPDTGKSREIDIHAIGGSIAGPGEYDYLFPVMLVECSLKTHRLWRWSCADGYAFRHNKGSDA